MITALVSDWERKRTVVSMPYSHLVGGRVAGSETRCSDYACLDTRISRRLGCSLDQRGDDQQIADRPALPLSMEMFQRLKIAHVAVD